MSPKRFPPTMVRSLRNDIPIDTVITSVLDIAHKHSEGFLRFVCPLCGEAHTATNPRTNLARCFRCEKNFNPIDMVMTVNHYSFVKAVHYLQPFLPINTKIQPARSNPPAG